MKKKSLYNIENEYLEILEELDQTDGEVTEELASKLQINEIELKEKSISFLAVITSHEEENRTIDAEIKRLQAIKKRNTNIVARLKDSLLASVLVHGSFSSGLTKFGIRKSSAVKIISELSLDEKYLVRSATISPNKALIKEELKNGVKIEGAEIVENSNLKIN